MNLRLVRIGQSTGNLTLGKLTGYKLRVQKAAALSSGAAKLILQLIYLKLVYGKLLLKSRFLDLKMSYYAFRIEHSSLRLKMWGWCHGISNDDLDILSGTVFHNHPTFEQ
jgi:hypothetical protein